DPPLPDGRHGPAEDAVTSVSGSGKAVPTAANKAGLPSLLDELAWRGMVHGTTTGVPARLATGQAISGYNGFDPSGPDLHIGHLVPIMGLFQFQRHCGRPVALVGCGLGMIVDSLGTAVERN